MDSATMAGVTKLVSEFGFPLALSMFLLWYVFKNQREINAQAHAREVDHRDYIKTLKDQILITACDSNKIIKTVSDDVEVLDEKIQKVDAKVDTVNGKMDQAIGKIDKAITKLDVVHEKIRINKGA